MTQKTTFGKKELAAVFAISIIGLLIRLYQLGTDGFWFDEIGVALAIRSSDAGTLLESVRSHVMAMPLDYILGWLMTRSCQNEACLRLPAALWGALTIPVSYLLFRQMIDSRVAIFGIFLLALSPLHIYYSQELRFYTSLVFFYILSTLLLLNALRQPTLFRWLVFTLAIIIGSYFHLYVCLSLINGGVWLLLSWKQFPDKKKILVGLFGSVFIISSFVLPGYLYFKPGASYEMFSLTEAIVGITIGFGWLPTALFPLQPGFVWYPVFLSFQLIGVRELVRSRNQMVYSWVLSSLLQVGIIFFANVVTQYALRGRQLLIMMPILCLVAARGGIELFYKPYRLIEEKYLMQSERSRGVEKIYKSAYLFVVVTAGIVISILSLQSYYRLEKSNRREISLAFIQRWKPGGVIWITPAWEETFYEYYLDLLGHSEIKNDLIGADQFQRAHNAPLPVCWITPQSIPVDKSDILIQSGFQIVPIQSDSVTDSHVLWCR